MIDVKLNSPIEAHGEVVDSIILREPKAGDIIKLGWPMDINSTGEVVMNSKIVGDYISVLGNIPPSAVKELSVNDFMKLNNEIISFFGDGQPA